MAKVYVSVGSNVEREKHITAALDALAKYGKLTISSIFESEAVGFDGEPFYNLVVSFATDVPLANLAAELKQIEDANGRNRRMPKFSARTLDIDILLYDELAGEFDGIELPRDEITRNAFVLRPLAEIAPDLKHPVRNISFRELWQGYQADQRLWPVDFVWQGRVVSKAK